MQQVKRKSHVWDFMEELSQGVVICTLCGDTLTFKTITTLIEHLQFRHPSEYAAKNWDDSEIPEKTSESESQELDLSYEPSISENTSPPKSKKSGPKSDKRRSEVWTYFTKLEEAGIVLCQLCETRVAHSGNTTNMIKHLAQRHTSEAAQITIKKVKKEKEGNSTSATKQRTFRPKIPSFRAREPSLKKYGQPSKITNKTLKLVTIDEKEISVVEDQSFDTFVEELKTRLPEESGESEHQSREENIHSTAKNETNAGVPLSSLGRKTRLNKSSQNVLAFLTNKSGKTKNDDAFDIYGAYVASSLREVSGKKLPHVQRLINEIIFLAQTDKISQDTAILNNATNAALQYNSNVAIITEPDIPFSIPVTQG